jgi:two-component system nitrogen regulation response regulator GlnG
MPNLLVIDDDAAVLHVFRNVFREAEVNVLTASCGAEGLALLRRHQPDVVILDIVLPDESGMDVFREIRQQDGRIPVVLITASGTAETAIEAMKLGAFDYLVKPLDFPRVRELVAQALEIRRFMHVPVRLVRSGQREAATDALVGRCPAMQEVYKAIGRVAAQRVNVLIRGESGTGKELVARAIYQHSPRSTGQFLAVNCAAIPEPLLESELFGHEKGAFTGADSKRIGKFEQCSGGTLFLDEVGDMTPVMQSKVLRVLQEQSFERVGGTETIRTDAWIIAATNRDLEQMVADGQFRSDLYYRLNGFTIKLPALRERAEDIVVLVEHFLDLFNRELGKAVCEVSPRALEMLMRYGWPGNVRELQSVLKRALLHATGSLLLPEFLPPEIRSSGRDGARKAESAPGAIDGFVDQRLEAGSENLYAECLGYMERLVLTRVLRHAHGNQSRAAAILGITRGSLRNKIRALGITINQAVNVREDDDEPVTLSSVG